MKQLIITASLFSLSLAGYAQIEKGTIGLNAGIQFNSGTTDKIETKGYTDPLLQQKNYTTDGTSNIGVSFYLSAGYFIQPNLEVGIMGMFGTSSSVTPMAFDKNTGVVSDITPQSANINTVLFDNRTASTTWGAGVFVNKYFGIGTGNKWFWNLNNNLFFESTKNSITDVYAYDPGKLGTGSRPAQYRSREKDNPASPNTMRMSFGVAPGIQYFFHKNWSAGASLGNILQVSYATTEFVTEEYINNGTAGGYPSDIDRISKTYTGNELGVTARLPLITSGNLLIGIAYYIR